MPRVFHLIKSLGRGGAEILLTEGLRYSDRQQFAYGYGYFIPWKTAMVPLLGKQACEVVCFGSRNNASILWAARRVANHLQRWGADLLHCHLPIAGVVGRLAGKMRSIPVIYTEHNRMERYHPFTRRLNILTWSWQNRVIAVSAEVAASIRKHTTAGVPIQIVLNGVDVDLFDRSQIDALEVRRKLGIPPESPIVGTVAVFRIQKRLDDWLEAARQLSDFHPDIHFLLVGDGPLREELVNRSLSLGLRDRVHFPGLQDDVRPFLAAMNVFMVSSAFEGLPLALLEAMAMRCGVVATGVGGIPEVIRHGENGYLVEPFKPEILARRASELVAAPEITRRLGEAARRTVNEEFSLERMTRQLEGVYLEVLEETHNGR